MILLDWTSDVAFRIVIGLALTSLISCVITLVIEPNRLLRIFSIAGIFFSVHSLYTIYESVSLSFESVWTRSS